MTVTYVANDGTIFYNEKSCLDYEKSFNLSQLVMLDTNIKRVTHINKAKFIYLRNKEELEIAKFYALNIENEDLALIGAGLYYKDDKTNCFKPITTALEELEAQIAILTKAAKKLFYFQRKNS